MIRLLTPDIMRLLISGFLSATHLLNVKHIERWEMNSKYFLNVASLKLFNLTSKSFKTVSLVINILFFCFSVAVINRAWKRTILYSEVFLHSIYYHWQKFAFQCRKMCLWRTLLYACHTWCYNFITVTM